MNNQELLNAGAGYVTGNSIAGSIVYNIRQQREELQRKMAHTLTEDVLSSEIAKFLLCGNKDGAYEYLNSHFNEEIIDVAQNQTDFIFSLETMLKKKKDKYNPFYEKIDMQMPDNLSKITADELCHLLGVENLHIIDSIDGKTSPSHKSNSGWVTTETVISAIIILVVIIISIIAS